jgi:hypothetical protein
VLRVAARRWVLTDNTFWHTWWDHIDYFIDYIVYFIDYIDFLRLLRLQSTAPSSSATSTSAVKMPNKNPITYEELSDEHKQKYNDIKALFEADLIGSFERTRHHSIRWKGFSSEGALEEVDLSTPTEERTRALRQEVNYMVAHSLHRQSESLLNTLERVAVPVVQEIMKYQYSLTGPALGSHKGELPSQARPPVPYAFAAPEQHNSPAYVIFKVGGDPADHQFFSEPPKEAPHGYICAYIPDGGKPAQPT